MPFVNEPNNFIRYANNLSVLTENEPNDFMLLFIKNSLNAL